MWRRRRLPAVTTAVLSSAVVAAVATIAAAGAYDNCRTVIVGAGIGGAYTAWRMSVDATTGGATAEAPSVCVFEASSRPGGRIRTVTDLPPGFRPNSAVDLGAYRFHRGEHPLVRSLAEGPLGLTTHCYSDPLGDALRSLPPARRNGSEHPTRQVTACPPIHRPLLVTRGKRYEPPTGVPFSASETVASQVEAMWTSDLPYAIPEAGRWGLGGSSPRAPRSPFGLLFGPTSVLPEVASRWIDLVTAPDYAAAMAVADAMLAALRTATYAGVPLHEVSVYQLAIAEGLSSEELALSSATSAGSTVAAQAAVANVLAETIRGIATSKAPIDGPIDYVVPVAADASGSGVRRTGMVSIVQGLLDAAKSAGARVFYDHRLVLARRWGPSVVLGFANDKVVLSGRRLFLNLAKPDIVALGGASLPIAGGTPAFRRALGALRVYGLSKAYCAWDDAWWLSSLNATAGVGGNGGPTISLRYHDGSVTCSNAAARTGCSGALLVSYNIGDLAGAASGGFLASYDAEGLTASSGTDALQVLTAGSLSPRGRLLWGALHADLRRAHNPLLAAAGVPGGVPDAAACVTVGWVDRGVHVATPSGIGAGHPDASLETFVMPLGPAVSGRAPVHLVGEAYSQEHAWAESALRSAERALHHGVGLPRPSWMDALLHESVIVKYNRGG
ncbi:hypothetical protein MMPV_003194 [Pyropia vietnamensis]